MKKEMIKEMVKYQFAEGYCSFFCNTDATSEVKQELSTRTLCSGEVITVEQPVQLEANQYGMACDVRSQYAKSIFSV